MQAKQATLRRKQKLRRSQKIQRAKVRKASHVVLDEETGLPIQQEPESEALVLSSDESTDYESDGDVQESPPSPRGTISSANSESEQAAKWKHKGSFKRTHSKRMSGTTFNSTINTNASIVTNSSSSSNSSISSTTNTTGNPADGSSGGGGTRNDKFFKATQAAANTKELETVSTIGFDEGRKSFDPYQLVKGDLLPIPEHCWKSNLRIGLGWHGQKDRSGKRKEVDLDAAVIAYAGKEKWDQVDFGNSELKGGGVVYEGDSLEGGAGGDDETIVLNLDQLDPSITQLFVFVTLFSKNSTFQDLDDIHVRLLAPVKSHGLISAAQGVVEKEICRHDAEALQSVPSDHKTLLVGFIKSGWKHGWSFHGVHGSVKGTSTADIHSLTAPELVQKGTLLWAKSKWRKAFSLTRKSKDSWLDLVRKRSIENVAKLNAADAALDEGHATGQSAGAAADGAAGGAAAGGVAAGGSMQGWGQGQ
jgi:stress response protein SCP2